ncbi:MAG TPA: hypothetical protein VKG84_07105 [Candidatus Acidoferrales bacterium]|nr:hypothetical protein [Candidatus Acidoferrales bacterium]
MSSQMKLRVLGGLGVVLLLVVFVNFQGSTRVAPGAAADETFHAIAVENPALHLDRIEELRKLEYQATGRDIFTSELPKPPAPHIDPPPDPGPPPVVEPPFTVPFKFYGFTTDAATGQKRGFFTNGEDVFIVSEGELVLGKYKVLSIGNTTAEVEEAGSGKRAKLAIDAPGGSGASPDKP